jgi:hypothetical protein
MSLSNVIPKIGSTDTVFVGSGRYYSNEVCVYVGISYGQVTFYVLPAEDFLAKSPQAICLEDFMFSEFTHNGMTARDIVNYYFDSAMFIYSALVENDEYGISANKLFFTKSKAEDFINDFCRKNSIFEPTNDYYGYTVSPVAYDKFHSTNCYIKVIVVEK